MWPLGKSKETLARSGASTYLLDASLSLDSSPTLFPDRDIYLLYTDSHLVATSHDSQLFWGEAIPYEPSLANRHGAEVWWVHLSPRDRETETDTNTERDIYLFTLFLYFGETKTSFPSTNSRSLFMSPEPGPPRANRDGAWPCHAAAARGGPFVFVWVPEGDVHRIGRPGRAGDVETEHSRGGGTHERSRISFARRPYLLMVGHDRSAGAAPVPCLGGTAIRGRSFHCFSAASSRGPLAVDRLFALGIIRIIRGIVIVIIIAFNPHHHMYGSCKRWLPQTLLTAYLLFIARLAHRRSPICVASSLAGASELLVPCLIRMYRCLPCVFLASELGGVGGFCCSPSVRNAGRLRRNRQLV